MLQYDANLQVMEGKSAVSKVPAFLCDSYPISTKVALKVLIEKMGAPDIKARKRALIQRLWLII